MAITPQYPSGYNTYVPNTQATNNLIIDFARNIKDFKLNLYTQTIKVTENVGMYTRMTNEVCSRFLNSNDSVWADANERPLGAQNLESFADETYRTIRRTFPVTLGYLSTQQASWNMTSQYQKILGTQAMTARAATVVKELLNPANYTEDHKISVKNASTGGSSSEGWDTSQTSDGHIKRTIYDAVNVILRDTLGVVSEKDLMLVLSAEAAAKLMQSQEVVDYIKGTPDSWKFTQGTLATGMYGMPETLFGIRVVVEDSVKVTSRKGEARKTEWLWPTDTAVICARPGGITAMQGPNFSTCVLFAKEEMTSETFDDARNRRTVLSVTEDYCAKVIAPVSGVLLQELFSTSPAIS